MNLIKSLTLTIAALSCTAVYAQDGSERAGQAAQKMRIAQQIRANTLQDNSAVEYVRADEKPRADQTNKSEG